MKRMSVIAVGLSLASVGVAQTEDNPPLFDKLDADNDGQINIYEAEVYKPLLDQFSQLDKDGDGRLSRQEFAALKGAGH